jgi:ubiquitin-conjugating enzyme E2 variant
VIVIKVVVTWLVVDWISGVVHWFEDSYGHPSLRFVGRRITKPNLRHHFRPRAFVANSWYASSELLLFSCLAALFVAWLIGQLSPMIVAAQHLKLIQSPSHHQRHHVDGKDSHYCVLTDFLNPILDYCRFWRGLEALARAVGLRKRNDDLTLAAVLLDEPDFLDKVR